jgi:hypothetical protein
MPHHAWITCDADEEANVSTVLVNHSHTQIKIVHCICQLAMTTDPMSWSPKKTTQKQRRKIDVDVSMPRWCWVCQPPKRITTVHNTVLCESRLISKQDVSYILCVHNTFCKKPLARRDPCTMVRSEGLHWLDVVSAEWVFMENSPNEGSTLVPGSSCALLNMRTSRKHVTISAGVNFWTCVNWNCFCSYKWVLYTLLNPVMFITSFIIYR